MSCLFNSLGRLLGENPAKLRQNICDALRDNESIIDGMSTHEVLRVAENVSDPMQYIERMRSPCTWGGAIEIQTACILYGMRVVVQNRRDCSMSTIEFLPHNQIAQKTATIYWTGGHYEPISMMQT